MHYSSCDFPMADFENFLSGGGDELIFFNALMIILHKPGYFVIEIGYGRELTILIGA